MIAALELYSYKGCGTMQGIMIITLIVFTSELIITLKNYYMFKGSGTIIGRFKHSSDLKVVSLIILIMAIIFSIWIKENYSGYIINNLFLVFYVAIIVVNYHRDVLITNEGIFINGRFIKWGLVKGIKEYDKQSLRIEIVGRWFKVQVVNRVKMLDELLKLIEMKVKK